MDSSLIYLVQTDTTVGFLSLDDKKLSNIKQRDTKQKILQVVDSFKTLNRFTRVPKLQRKKVRNSTKTTFIYPNGLSFRVVGKESLHHNFINKFHFLYSTSANETKKEFNKQFAIKNSDIIIYNKYNFSQNKSSTIYKINNKRIKRIR